MDDAKQQILEKLQNANNILVTVSANPSVDQLAACIGLTLLLNKMNKHATAVFSGKVPSTIEFLKPEETLETNTDSLRDFIIALDKSKADKLRYKVEDEVVKIFITPYKASISDKDLIFSQGDFNVDVVMALGVHQAADLDNAITAHGRILHDAVVICLNTATGGELGSINWLNPGASGVSELVTSLASSLDPSLLDEQIATALLTGIVAETKHFSNEKTTPGTMTSSASLLAAGANQQLVSTELSDEHAPVKQSDAPPAPAPKKQREDGELDVPHNEDKKPEDEKPADKSAAESAAKTSKKSADKLSEKTTEKPAPKMKRIEPLPEEPEEKQPETETAQPAASQDNSDTVDHSIDALLKEAEEELNRPPAQLPTPAPAPSPEPSAPLIQLPPAPEEPKPAPEELKVVAAAEPVVPTEQPPAGPQLSSPVPAESVAAPTPEPAAVPTPMPQPVTPLTPAPALGQADEPANVSAADDNQTTLSEIEESVHSPHVDMADEADVDSARKAVEDALKGAPNPIPEPLERAGSTVVDLDLGHGDPLADQIPDSPEMQPEPGVPPAPVTPTDGLPDYLQTPSVAPPVPPSPPAMPPSDNFASVPVPSGINVPPPQAVPPTSTTLPPQGPPPPPVPPPMPGV